VREVVSGISEHRDEGKRPAVCDRDVLEVYSLLHRLKLLLIAADSAAAQSDRIKRPNFELYW
jgi:hypothetical protein